MKETLDEMKKRHSKELAAFQKSCPHKRLIVLETSLATCGMHSPLRDRAAWKAIAEHKTMPKNEHELAGYESVLVKCKDCGMPLVEYGFGKLYVYVQPHYVSDGITLPEKKP
jgi:hypothetical protein